MQVVLLLLMYIFKSGPGFEFNYFYLVMCIVFYAAQWEEYNTGIYRTSQHGVGLSEQFVVMNTLILIQGISGGSFSDITMASIFGLDKTGWFAKQSLGHVLTVLFSFLMTLGLIENMRFSIVNRRYGALHMVSTYLPTVFFIIFLWIMLKFSTLGAKYPAVIVIVGTPF